MIQTYRVRSSGKIDVCVSIALNLKAGIEAWANDRSRFNSGITPGRFAKIFYEDTENGDFVQVYPVINLSVSRNEKTMIKLAAVKNDY